MSSPLRYVTPEEYLKLRVANIRRQLPMARVLLHYGVELRYPDPHQETSYSCPLHGDGNDSRPSARLYPESQSTYCFACQRARDAVGWVREKEGLPFWAAVRRLEEIFDLEPLPSHIAMQRDAAGVSADAEAGGAPALEAQLRDYFREEAPPPDPALSDPRAPDFSGAEERARRRLVSLTEGLPLRQKVAAWGVWWASKAEAELSDRDANLDRAQAQLATLFQKLAAKAQARPPEAPPQEEPPQEEPE